MNKELAKTIGTAARNARKAQQLTQEDIAERVDVSVEFYARIERGTSLPSILTFARIVSALGISADVLLGQLPRIVPMGGNWMPAKPSDGPEVRRVVRRLRRAEPGTLRLVNMLLKALESADEGKQTSDDAGADPDANTEVESEQDADAEDLEASADDEPDVETSAASPESADEPLLSATKGLDAETQPAGMRPLSKPRRVFTFGSTANAAAE